jgi:hypothetical protein
VILPFKFYILDLQTKYYFIMKSLLLTFLFIFNFSYIQAQIFEKGYFIDDNNVKKECFIEKNILYNSPVVFKYRLEEKGSIEIASIEQVKEVSLIDLITYYRHTVFIDQSSSSISELDNNKKLNLVEKKVFLEILDKGKVNLYQYKTSSLIRFFFLKEGEVTPDMLDYKKYFHGDNQNYVTENQDYKQELFNLFKEGGISLSEIERIKYDETDLTTLFKKYNSSFGKVEKVNNSKKSKELSFNVLLKPKVSINNSEGVYTYNSTFDNFSPSNFESKFSVGFGFDLELDLIKNYTFFFNPNYHSYKSESSQIIYGESSTNREVATSTDFKSIKLNLGVRKYFILNPKVDLYIGGAFLFDKILKNDEANLIVSPRLENLESTTGFSFLLGSRISKSFFVELNYDTNRNFLRKSSSSNFIFKTYGISLMYDILSLRNKK